MSTQTSGAGYSGFAGVSEKNSQYQSISFLIKQILAEVQTATLVQVQAVNGNTGIAADTGTVDVLPLVNMLDGIGNAYEHSTVHGMPYVRLQGGVNAVVCDPVVGDIGLAIFASRDISLVKKSQGQNNPGSRRRFNWADGIYLGGLLNAAPTQYLYFTSTGIHLYDKNGNQITTNAAGIAFADNNSNVISMTSGGISLSSSLVKTSSVFQAGNGASGTFTSADGKTITVSHGIITSIV